MHYFTLFYTTGRGRKIHFCLEGNLKTDRENGRKPEIVSVCVRQYIKRDTHSCIEHLVAEAAVKLLWVGLWKEKIRAVERERENTLNVLQSCWN